MLFRTKVGKYTAEEFEKAFGQFQDTGRPRICTCFHDSAQMTGEIDRTAVQSLWAFQDRLKSLGHFQTKYETEEGLLLHFTEQLERVHPTTAASPAVAGPPPADLTPCLTQRAATWRAGAAGQLDRRFVDHHADGRPRPGVRRPATRRAGQVRHAPRDALANLWLVRGKLLALQA